MIDIEKLETLAKAATPAWWANLAISKSVGPHLIPGVDAEHIAAANPAAILELCAEVRRLREIQAANVEIKIALQAEKEKLRNEVSALAPSAKRYQWLRDARNNGFPISGPERIGNFEVSQKVRDGEAHYYNGRFLDGAIDDQMEKGKS